MPAIGANLIIGGAAMRAAGGGMAPLSNLFANGEQGFLFSNFSDLTKLLRRGSLTPTAAQSFIAADNDPVGIARCDVGNQQTTNQIRNNSMQGAAAGAPGVLPNFWAHTNGVGLTRTIVGVGTEVVNGVVVDYIEIRANGTTGDANGNQFRFEGLTQIPALSGETWTESFFLSLVGGTFNNVNFVQSNIVERTAAGATVVSSFGGDVKAAVTATLQRFKHSRVLAGGATVAVVQPIIHIGAPSGVAVDYTIRIGLPQMERQPVETAPIRTTNAAITRTFGNHLWQRTDADRPLWRASAGKPYLQLDGLGDYLLSPFVPTSALTMAVAFNTTLASRRIMGGGASTGNKRATIGLDASGHLEVNWGGFATEGANDRRNTNMVVVVAGSGLSRDVYVNGAIVPAFGAPTSSPDGTGGGFALGAYNDNGVFGQFADGRLYAALALNRRASPAEAYDIYRQFALTF